MKVWNERRIYTEEQIAIIQPNEEMNSVVLLIKEANDEKFETRLYLSFDEAEMLAKQLNDFIKDNRI